MESQLIENEQITNIIMSLEEIYEDSVISKSVKIKLEEVINLLKTRNDPLTINKSIDELEQLTNEYHLESFTRTQIFNIISLMELMLN